MSEEYEIIGYYCLTCGHDQDDNGWGGECDHCGCATLEEIVE